MIKWLRIFLWLLMGFLFGLVAAGVLSCNAQADEHWSNYPRLPKIEMELYDDGTWGLFYGGYWIDSQRHHQPHQITSGHWRASNPSINICQDSTVVPQSLTPEFVFSATEQLISIDTTFSSIPVNLGVEWELIDNIYIPSDTLGPGRNIAMIQGVIQFVVGVRKNGFCAHRAVRFYLEPHADRLAYQP